MKTIKKIDELKPFFDLLIKRWDLNENNEKDEYSVRGNCCINSIGVYFNFKSLYKNKIKLCYGSWGNNLAHYWNKIKIGGRWEYIDITFYYDNNLIRPDISLYKENTGGYLNGKENKEELVYYTNEDLKNNLIEGIKLFEKGLRFE